MYVRAFRGARAIVSYAESEAAWLREWLGPGAPPVVFVPFGVDANAFRPALEQREDVDVLSVGADPRRDFGLLLGIAARHPELKFRIVASRAHARAFTGVPPNVAIETDIPLERVRDRFAQARLVALPVSDNSYSGATTVLLQAMAMGKPVVVSRTDAIADGLRAGGRCELPAGEARRCRRAGARGAGNAYGRGCRNFSRHPRPRNG